MDPAFHQLPGNLFVARTTALCEVVRMHVALLNHLTERIDRVVDYR